MSETVAVRSNHWHSLTVFHEIDDNGAVQCHLSERDITFRTVERDELPDSVRRCANCAGRGYGKGSHNGQGWAARLRAAEDPEEVLANND